MSKVLKVEEIGEHETYDLEVEHQDHQFYLSNGVLTSNSHAVSYAMVSYWCAWMLYYYPDEWICAWCESMSGTNEDRALAYRTVRRWGGKVQPIDARKATDRWEIIEEGVYMPSLGTAQSVGKTALRELMRYQPFESMRELLYGNGTKYRLSKLNRKALENLARIGAFNCFVGEGKEFSNINHLLEVVVSNNAKIKKTLKTKPDVGYDTYNELLSLARETRPRTREEIIADQEKILGMVSPDLLITDEVVEVFEKLEIEPLENLKKADVCWFLVSDAKIKTTRTGKPYLLLSVVDGLLEEYRLFVWNFPGDKSSVPAKWTIMAGKVERNDFGLKSTWKNLKIIDADAIMELDETSE